MFLENISLIIVFICYLFGIPAFGFWYYSLYKIDRKSFVFARDIYITKIAETRKNQEDKLFALKTVFPYFNKFNSDRELGLTKFVTEQIGSSWSYPDFHYRATLSDGSKLEIQKQHRVDPPDAVSEILPLIIINSPSGSEIWNGRLWGIGFLSDHKDNPDEFVSTALVKMATLIEETNTRLNELSGPEPKIWTYIDFIYFSLITQSTVGYGDILPNSSKVRIGVVCQIIFAYTILILVLNIVIS